MPESPNPSEPFWAEIKGLVGYYLSVLRRALRDTFSFTEWTRRAVLMSIALYLLSVWIAAWRSPEAILKEIPTLEPWLLGVAIFVGFLLAINIVRAPRLILQDSEARERRLETENAGLLTQLQPELDITFADNQVGFVDTFIGQTPDRKTAECKIYRVAVTSRSTSPWTRLKVEKVSLSDGTTYSDLFLRIMHREPDKTQTQLHAGVPQLWDVVQKAAGSEWVSLTHAEKNVPALLLRAPCQLTITASCVGGFPVSKLVSLSLNKAKNNELIFRLGDVI